VEKETRWNSGAPMTDEELQKLCVALRRKGLNDRAALCYAAADEIERLAAALARSDAEPDDPEDRDPSERVSIPRIEILNRDKRITELETALALANDGWAKANSEILRLQSHKDDEIERLAALVHDYKLVFGDIHKTELAEMKYRVENTDTRGWTNVGWTDAEQPIDGGTQPAQSDAEPVAWQYRWKMDLFDGGKAWSPWHDLPERLRKSLRCAS
jgi:hypothetical protein